MIWASLTLGEKGASAQQPLRKTPVYRTAQESFSGILKRTLLHGTLSLAPKSLKID